MTEVGVATIENAQSASTGNAIVLARDPFAALGALPFRDAQCTRLLAQLNQLIDKTELLALVSGRPGSGKSVMARMFVEQAPSHFVVLSVDAAGGLRSVDLLAEVVERFGSRRRKNEDVRDLFTAHYSRGKQPVLVIDAAEHLEQRALRLAGELAEHGLHLVLIARSDREGYLAEHLDADRIQVLRLAPYDRRRTYCYLMHCLASAGYQGPMPFDARAVDDITANAGGTPAGINRLAHQYLVGQPPHGADQPATPSRKARPVGHGAGPKVVVAGVLLALLFGVLAVLMLTGRFGGGDADFEAGRAEAPVSTPSIDIEVSDGADLASLDESPNESLPVTGEPVSSVAKPSSIARHTPEPGSAVSPSPPLERDADDEVIEVPESIESRELDVVSEASDEPETAPSDTAAVTQSPASSGREAPEAGVEAARSIESRSESVAARSIEPTGGLLQPDNDAVRARDPRHYTMQLVAGPSLNAVQRFADRHGVAAESVVYQFDRDGTLNYALIYRDYETSAEALAALEALPEELRERKPWLRRLSAIQRAIGD